MLVHTICNPPLAIQQKKPSFWAKKIYSTKLKMFFFILQKLKDSISSLCHMKKQVCGISHIQAHINQVLLGCFWILDQQYLGMWLHAIFNVHFLVPVNFVLFVYLDVDVDVDMLFCFNEYLSFLLAFVPHYCDCFTTHFKDHLEIY